MSKEIYPPTQKTTGFARGAPSGGFLEMDGYFGPIPQPLRKALFQYILHL